MRQLRSWRIEHRRRERPTKTSNPQWADSGRSSVRNEVQVRYGLATALFPLSEEAEVLVVALDEVKRRARLRISPCGTREIADAEPHAHVGVPVHGPMQCVEVSVDIGNGADEHLCRRRLCVRGRGNE